MASIAEAYDAIDAPSRSQLTRAVEEKKTTCGSRLKSGLQNRTPDPFPSTYSGLRPLNTLALIITACDANCPAAAVTPPSPPPPPPPQAFCHRSVRRVPRPSCTALAASGALGPTPLHRRPPPSPRAPLPLPPSPCSPPLVNRSQGGRVPPPLTPPPTAL